MRPIYLLCRSASLSSELSANTSLDSLIGWAYSRNKHGDQGTLSKREAYKTRYVNDRVEVELYEFKQEISKKFKVSKIKDFVFPRKESNNQPQYGKKGSGIEPSKTQDLSQRDKDAKSKYKKALIDNTLKDDIANEMESESKAKNMNKYIKQTYKPFEYKDKPSHSKVKSKYFYPPQPINKIINIKNFETSFNWEYNEANTFDAFDSCYSQNKIRKLNKYNSKIMDESNDTMGAGKTNYTSQVTDLNKSCQDK